MCRGKRGNWYHSKYILGLDWKDRTVIWCPPCLGGWDREEQGQMSTCSLCLQNIRGVGSAAWHELSACRHETLITHRARLVIPLREVLTEGIAEMESAEWGQGSAMIAAFALAPNGSWAAPAEWVGQRGALDGTRGNPWYGLFPHEWLDGTWGALAEPIRLGVMGTAATTTPTAG